MLWGHPVPHTPACARSCWLCWCVPGHQEGQRGPGVPSSVSWPVLQGEGVAGEGLQSMRRAAACGGGRYTPEGTQRPGSRLRPPSLPCPQKGWWDAGPACTPAPSAGPAEAQLCFWNIPCARVLRPPAERELAGGFTGCACVCEDNSSTAGCAVGKTDRTPVT